VAELRLAGIATVAGANAFLPHFTPQFNARFARPPADPVPAWRPVPQGLDLARICSLYTEATVLNDNTVRTQGRILQIPPGAGATPRPESRSASSSMGRGASTTTIGSSPLTHRSPAPRSRVSGAGATAPGHPAGVTFSLNS
jgi:hypothetical protein